MAGLTPGEAKVMAMHELGYPPGDIARELAISPARVRCIVTTFDDDPVQDDRREARVRRGSAALLRRLKAAGGHR
ncbi:MAG: hypothetical protein AAFQ13_06085 [Pseudomonadota bacterium]